MNTEAVKVNNSLEEDQMNTSEAQINANDDTMVDLKDDHTVNSDNFKLNSLPFLEGITTTLVANEEAITPSKYQRVLPQSGIY